mgnify:CR=1 FL=1
MASKAVRHAYTTIGLAMGLADRLAEMYQDQPNNKTMMKYVERIRTRTEVCFNLWPDKITPKEKKRIEARMQVLEDIAVADRQHDATVLTSLILALLSDLHKAVTPAKKQAIDSLLSAYKRVHHYYDRRLDKWSAYDLANYAINKMEEQTP